jgi:hypothetical protein
MPPAGTTPPAGACTGLSLGITFTTYAASMMAAEASSVHVTVTRGKLCGHDGLLLIHVGPTIAAHTGRFAQPGSAGSEAGYPFFTWPGRLG